MKLTKGKIAKLYNKRKQTLKKKSKPKRSTGKSKTFRQNRKVNLSRQSLRRFSRVGGRLPVNVSTRVLSVADTGLSGAQQGLSAANELVSNVDQVVSEVPPVGPIGEARLGLTAAEMGISGVQKGVEAAQGVINPSDELPEPAVGPELPVVGSELQEPVVETELPEQAPPATLEQTTPALDETKLQEQTAPIEPELQEQTAPIEPVLQEQTAPTEPELQEPVAPTEPVLQEEAVAPTEPVLQEEAVETEQPSNQQNTRLNDAVKTIVDEITKKVEEQVATSLARDVTPDTPDDGFKAFTGAVDKLSNDTPAIEPEPKMGGKRRNTRRFKLVKNKTKRSTP